MGQFPEYSRYFNSKILLAKGLSSFVAGQLVGNEILTIGEMFRVISLYTTVAATTFYLVYICFGRKLEVKQAEKVDKERQELEAKNQIVRSMPSNMDAGILVSTL